MLQHNKFKQMIFTNDYMRSKYLKRYIILFTNLKYNLIYISILKYFFKEQNAKFNEHSMSMYPVNLYTVNFIETLMHKKRL